MKGRATAVAAIALSGLALGAVAALAYDILSRPDCAWACRVQGTTSQACIRSAVSAANQARGDKIAVLIKALGLAP